MAHSHTHDRGWGSHSHGHDDAHSHSTDSIDSDDSRQSEAWHQATVAATFDSYRQQALSANQRRRADYYALSARHRELLPGYNELLAEVDAKLQFNADLVRRMIDCNPFPPPGDAALSAPAPTEADHEGRNERDTAYTPILETLRAQFHNLTPAEQAQTRVLVPGAGLGRLAWEILIASAFILNQTTRPREFPLHPYLHSFSNIRNKDDLLVPSWIPDVAPSEIAEGPEETRGDFSFAAGDFLELYGDAPGDWDVCVTCFFLDTARNIVQYLETIWGLLKPGGMWINCGPTLWHFENDHDASSIELTLDDVKALARRIGFELSEEREITTSYTTNPRSLLKHEYTAAFWVARKVEGTAA
ncbi:SPOSA6832_01221, partial [Sporobolomyces salmonicolor]